jgi:hypothetical protein
MRAPALARPQAGEFLAYYGRYVDLVPEGDILATLANQNRETVALLRSLPEERSLYRYEPGKWSIKELVGHITDAERIFSDRALRFARNDATDQPGFEENDYVANGGFDSFAFTELITGYETVRLSTLALLKTVSPEASTRQGKANGAAISVRALAYVIAGHELHHVNVLKTRYLLTK